MTRIVAIDPSTTRIGWAFFAGGRLERAGLVLPERTADDWYDRACSMVDELWPVIERAAPRTVIVEVPSEGHGSGSQAGATGRLAIYGCAVGMVLHDLRMALPDNLVDPCSLERVTEREWTRGTPDAIGLLRIVADGLPVMPPAAEIPPPRVRRKGVGR